MGSRTVVTMVVVARGRAPKNFLRRQGVFFVLIPGESVIPRV